jgi:hypothetical protein
MRRMCLVHNGNNSALALREKSSCEIVELQLDSTTDSRSQYHCKCRGRGTDALHNAAWCPKNLLLILEIGFLPRPCLGREDKKR